MTIALRQKGQLAINRLLRLRDVYGLRSFPRVESFDLEDLKRLNRCFIPPTVLEYSFEARRTRAMARIRTVARAIPLAGSRMLDVGTGHGELVWAARSHVARAVGIDLDAAGLEQASREGLDWQATGSMPQFVCADAAAMPFGKRSFDSILSYWAMEHFGDYQGVMDEFARILAPGGRLFLEFGPLFYSPYGHHLHRFIHIPWVHLLFPEAVIFEYLREVGAEWWIEAYQGLNRLTTRGFLAAVDQSGLTVCRLRRHTTPLGRLPVSLRSRLVGYPSEELTCSTITCVLGKP